MRSNTGMANRQGYVDLRFALALLVQFIRPFIQAFVRSIQRSPYQEGRNNAGLSGHDGSWTGHYTAQQNSLSSSTQPCSYICASRHDTPCISDCRQHHWGRPGDIYRS